MFSILLLNFFLEVVGGALKKYKIKSIGIAALCHVFQSIFSRLHFA